MAYTNGKIPKFNEHSTQLYISKMEAELEFYKKLSENYANELRNIPESIEAYGRWTCNDQNGNEIKLIKEE